MSRYLWHSKALVIVEHGKQVCSCLLVKKNTPSLFWQRHVHCPPIGNGYLQLKYLLKFILICRLIAQMKGPGTLKLI